MDRDEQDLRIAGISLLEPCQETHRVGLPIQKHRAIDAGQTDRVFELVVVSRIPHGGVEQRQGFGTVALHSKLNPSIRILYRESRSFVLLREYWRGKQKVGW